MTFSPIVRTSLALAAAFLLSACQQPERPQVHVEIVPYTGPALPSACPPMPVSFATMKSLSASAPDIQPSGSEWIVVVRTEVPSGGGPPLSAEVIKPSDHPEVDRFGREVVLHSCFPGTLHAMGSSFRDVTFKFRGKSS